MRNGSRSGWSSRVAWLALATGAGCSSEARPAGGPSGAMPEAAGDAGGAPSPAVAFRRLVEVRRSIRAFEAREVAEADLQAVLETVRLAPSAGNLQAFEIVVVREAATRAALSEASFGQAYVAEAPVVLAFVAQPAESSGRYGERGADLYALQDATIAATYAMLAVAARGLGSVWVGAFDEASAARALGCAPGDVPVALLPIGYPAESPPPRPRKPLEELVRRR